MTWKPVRNARLIGYRSSWTEYESHLEGGKVTWVLTSDGSGVWKHQARLHRRRWYLLSTIGQLNPQRITAWMPLPRPPKKKEPGGEGVGR